MNDKRTTKRSGKARRGAYTVEFALTVPLLFFLVFGLIEFSRVNMIRHTLDNAVYEGARKGLNIAATESDVQSQVQSLTNIVGIVNPTINVTLTSTTVTVQATVDLEANSWGISSFFAGKQITSSVALARK